MIHKPALLLMALAVSQAAWGTIPSIGILLQSAGSVPVFADRTVSVKTNHGSIRLSGTASAASIAAAEAGAARTGWRHVKASQSQSFRVVAGEREVATLVTGEATLAPDVPGCFAAVVQGDRVALVPTIGQGEYETTACGGPVATGILSPRQPASIGVVFKSYSPNAESLEPIAFTWDAATNRFAIDAARSKAASLAGAQSIADMKRALR